MKGWIEFTRPPLSEAERQFLLAAVWDAQAASARANTQNASNVAVCTVGQASLTLTNALAAGILATGGLHAPVTLARELIFGSPLPDSLPEGAVPGFGNSFHRGQIDPVWQPLAKHLKDEHWSAWQMIEAWAGLLAGAGKAHHVNAAGLTAAVAYLVCWPVGLEPVLVIQPRLTVWAALYLDATSGKGLA